MSVPGGKADFPILHSNCRILHWRLASFSFRESRTKAGLRCVVREDRDRFPNQRSDCARTRQVRSVASNKNAGLPFKTDFLCLAFYGVRFGAESGLEWGQVPLPKCAMKRHSKVRRPLSVNSPENAAGS
jgi:hypothetical protein